MAAVTTEGERIYDRHTYLVEMQAAVEWWEARFAAILAPEDAVAKAA